MTLTWLLGSSSFGLCAFKSKIKLLYEQNSVEMKTQKILRGFLGGGGVIRGEGYESKRG